MIYRYRALVTALAASASLCWQLPALADPPDWAPAHGAREHDEDRREARRDDHREDRYGDEAYEGHEHGQEGHHGYHGYYGYHGYHGYHGDDWNNDYGVVSNGRCNTDVLLGVTGAVGGAIIGNRTSAPENRDIATIFGAIAGGIIGSAVGDAIDDGDRACVGHSLELARVGHPVYWSNPRTHVAWRLVPIRDVSTVCREFEVHRYYYGRHGTERVIACRRTRGYWDVRG